MKFLINDNLWRKVLSILNLFPFLHKYLVNRYSINHLVESTHSRPYPLSMYSSKAAPTSYQDYFNPNLWYVTDYVSWPSLTDKRFSNRHLPPADNVFTENLPDLDKTTKLFLRGGRPMISSKNTSLLFMGFAQWFTDAFLRIDPLDIRRNTSNHEIDLCQIYGLDEFTTNILRSYNKGKLKSQMIDDQEYLPFLYEDGGSVKKKFKNLPYVQNNEETLKLVYGDLFNDDVRKSKFFVTGLERGNSTVSHATFNTLFMRAHNKICDRLIIAQYGWDDERLFQTSRNILLVILLQIVVEEYINHISSLPVHFSVDSDFAEKQNWYRTNWISTEFDLLYRWHSLIPDKICISGNPLDVKSEFRLNNDILIEGGVKNVLKDLSKQKAGKITLGNTPDFMYEAEKRALAISRGSKLKGYNDYRECYGFKRLRSIEELTSDEIMLPKLIELYNNDINNVELTVGLFAEKTNNVLGDLMIRMVAAEAFSHALTNPLLSSKIFHDVNTFSPKGVEIRNQIKSIADLVKFTENGSDNREYDSITFKVK